MQWSTELTLSGPPMFLMMSAAVASKPVSPSVRSPSPEASATAEAPAPAAEASSSSPLSVAVATVAPASA